MRRTGNCDFGSSKITVALLLIESSLFIAARFARRPLSISLFIAARFARRPLRFPFLVFHEIRRHYCHKTNLKNVEKKTAVERKTLKRKQR